jgi:adhesin transport system membrane fusion protein
MTQTPQPAQTPARREDIEFMGETAAAAMQGPPAYSHGLLWGMLAFVVVFFVWAAFANIGETTVGDGKVIPSSQVQVVQNLEGGIVAEIKVKVGDIVRKNQVLILIDDTRYASSFQENKAKNDALSAKIARLTAEVSGKPFDLPQRFRQDNPDLADRELTLYRSRQAEFAANTSVFNQQIDQRNRAIRALYHVASGLSLRQKGEHAQAQLQFETALGHDPECADALRALGKLDDKDGIFRRLR